MTPKKLRIILLIALLLMVVSPFRHVSASWAEPIYDAEVPAKARENVARAIDSTADLLSYYKIVLPKDIKIIVTADAESYIQAMMFYNKMTRMEAEKYLFSAGLSLGDKPIILIKGTPLLNTSLESVYAVLPHELFHQVQNQYGKIRTVNWLVEGTPEMFQVTVREKAGFGKVEYYIRQTENRIRKASTIPDVRDLADHANFLALTIKGYPVYAMSELMVARLMQDNGFENIVFFYQLLHSGSSPEKAFVTAFRVPMAWFLSDMNAYFEKLRSSK